MKYIAKRPEPECLVKFREAANENWQPSYNGLSGLQKNAVKDALIAEQGHICCYCEREIGTEDSHIEHFIPQSHPGCDPLDYGNMLCSCMKERKKGDTLHCGAKKDNWYDPVLLVSPLSPECEEKFVYTDDGRIKPKDSGDPAAVTTIEKLGLNCPKLVEERKKILDAVFDENLTNEEIAGFMNGYLMKQNGKFNPFWTMILSKLDEYFSVKP